MKLIVLAAGDSFELDGFHKLKIKNPQNGKTILEQYVEMFDVDRVQIVVGYKAMEVMNHFPNYQYIYNKKWQTTGSCYSLSLALTEEPCVVISSDFFISSKLKNLLNDVNNYTLIKKSESRRLTSLNAIVKDDIVTSVYRGKSKNNDPELLGIFKVDNAEVLRQWKRNCINNPRNYAGETFPYDACKIPFIIAEENSIKEINTPEDYINYIENINEHI